MAASTSVEDYLASVPAVQRAALEKLCKQICARRARDVTEDLLAGLPPRTLSIVGFGP